MMDINSDGTDRCFEIYSFFSQCLNIFKQNKFIDLKANTWFVLIYELKATGFLKIISRECGKITGPSEARTHDP